MRKAEKEGEEKMRKLKLFVFKDGQKFSLEDYRKLRDEIKNVVIINFKMVYDILLDYRIPKICQII